jgi:hypothetical protein
VEWAAQLFLMLLNVVTRQKSETSLPRAQTWNMSQRRCDVSDVAYPPTTIAHLLFAMQDGSTPLMIAASSGNVLILKALIELGADPNVEDVGGRNAFLHAAAEGRNLVVQTLLAMDDTQVFAATKVRQRQ